MSTGWQRTFGNLDLARPDAFRTLVNRQAELAAEATRIMLERLKAVFAEADALGHDDLPVLVSLPSILLNADAGELALPNLVTPFLDRRECARTVVLVDAVPVGGGQALRLLSDRGVNIAVTAAAAAGADPTDLFGWQRWAVVLPRARRAGPERRRRPDDPADRQRHRHPRHPADRDRRRSGRHAPARRAQHPLGRSTRRTRSTRCASPSARAPAVAR